jgi:predicted ATPase
MKHLIIDEIGPLKHVDIELGKVNVIIGPQSSGKSCVLKIASYCTWVEKRIELAQSAEAFSNDRQFLMRLVKYHKLQQYVRPNTRIEYESDFMHFAYSNEDESFKFEWKEGRWDYVRNKVAYIPAERNMVAAIPNWFDIKLDENNIRGFMSDWETSRKVTTNDLQVLNLDARYRYDTKTGKDVITVDGGLELDFTNTSSGLQSLIPLFVYLNYLSYTQYKQELNSVTTQNENAKLLEIIYNDLFVNTGKTRSRQMPSQLNTEGKKTLRAEITMADIGPYMLRFYDSKAADECKAIYEKYTQVFSCDVFLEEPEENLFPPTQMLLTDWLIELSKKDNPSRLFIATHSPYVLNSFVESTDVAYNLFTTKVIDGYAEVKKATEEDIQGILDYGVDAFLNSDTLG